MSAVAETIPGTVVGVDLIHGDDLHGVTVVALGDGLLVVQDGENYVAVPLSNIGYVTYAAPE